MPPLTRLVNAPTRRAFLRRQATAFLTIAMGSLAAPALLAAHPLPGAVIVIKVGESQVNLSLSVPAADLAIAMTEATAEDLDGAPVSVQTRSALASYFAQHIAIATAGQPGPALTLIDARTTRETHDHVGDYTVVILDFAAVVDRGRPVLPLTLTYDAVMHEVRNHQALVLWQTEGQEPIPVGEIRIDPATGRAAPLSLASAP